MSDLYVCDQDLLGVDLLLLIGQVDRSRVIYSAYFLLIS